MTILADWELLFAALEAGKYELANTHHHQNMVIHYLRRSMHELAIFLWELAHMAGSPFRPEELGEVSWQDLQWMEMACRASPAPVCGEVVEDKVTGVMTTVILPNHAESGSGDDSLDLGSSP